MKPLGIILIVVGILMFVFTNINFTTEKKVVDLGPVEVNKKEDKSIGWPIWAGGVAVIAGIVLIVADKRRA
jgi:drug/metabolite transporter (DMT)-like permease